MAEPIAVEPAPVNNHLMLDVWELILAFLEPTEYFIPSLVCKDFRIIINRMLNRHYTLGKMVTSINPYCKTPYLVKKCILKYNNDPTLLTMLFNWIYNIAMINGYLDTLKYTAFMQFIGVNVYETALTRKNYEFIIELINEYVPLPREFIESVILTGDIVFIKNVILALESNYSYNRNSSYYCDYFRSRKSIIIYNAIETRIPDIYMLILKHIICDDIQDDPYFLWNKYTDTLDTIKYKHEVLGIPLNDTLITQYTIENVEKLEYLISKNCPIRKLCYEELCTTHPELAAKINPDTITRKNERPPNPIEDDDSNFRLFD